MSGGVNAQFQFISYKVNSFDFKCEKSFGLVSYNGLIGPWELNIGFNIPMFSKKENVYICGLLLKGKTTLENQEGERVEVASFETEITGLFKTDGKIESAELEEKLVKIQAPAILMPYLRGTVSSYLSNAGFASVVLPLINVQKIANDSLGKESIIEID